MSIDIRYEVYDSNGPVGSISGDELRRHFRMTKHDAVFNDDLVKRWNAESARKGSEDRMRAIVVKNGKKVGRNA